MEQRASTGCPDVDGGGGDVVVCETDRATAVPFRQFVLKLHSRCNLACTYCYIYTSPDRSWRHRPRAAPPGTVRQTALRIAEHVSAHRLREIRIDLHGGEPLLTGPGPLLEQAQAIRAAVPAQCVVRFGVQTNGTLLTAASLGALADAGFRIGLSLDGGTAGLNRRRTDHAGRSSWPAASRAARLLSGRPGTFAGILCTIDLTADPAQVYRSLRAMGPPMLDFLLPHANWSSPPPPSWARRAPPRTETGCAPRSTSGGTVRDRDCGSGCSPRSSACSWGGPVPRKRSDSHPSSPWWWTPTVPSSRWTRSSPPTTERPRPAWTSSGTASTRPSRTRAWPPMRQGRDGLGAQCRSCALVEVCGGGNYAHRYRDSRQRLP